MNTNEEINIVDFGANIGLSVLYFAENYPKSSIEAYEADPIIFKYLEKNIKNNLNSSQIYLHNKAIWNCECKLNFYSEGADGGRIVNEQKGKFNSVEAVDAINVLRKYKKIDFLKIDIEGAELEVVPHIAAELYKVDNIFVECHLNINSGQRLSDVIDVLENAGFRLYIDSIYCPMHPLMNDMNIKSNEFDCQINIWGKMNHD